MTWININKAVTKAVNNFNKLNGTNLNPDVVIRTMHAESGGDPNIISYKTDDKGNYVLDVSGNKIPLAYGLFQLMPDTAQSEGLSFDEILDPQKNINVGVKYFGRIWQKYNKDYHLTAASYNWGPGALDNALARFGTPDRSSSRQFVKLHTPKETQNHVEKILHGKDTNGEVFMPNTSVEGGPKLHQMPTGEWINPNKSKMTQSQESGPVKVTTEYDGPSITDNEFFAVTADVIKQLKSLDDKTPGGQARLALLEDIEDRRREFSKLSPERRRQFLQKDLVDGLASGFAQGSQEKVVAQNRGATRGSIGYVTGMTLAKTTKAVAELGLNIAGMGTLSGVKAPGALLGVWDHFWNGFKLTGGSNLATNALGEGLSASLPGKNYKDTDQQVSSGIHMASEAGLSGLMGGVFNSGRLGIPGSSLDVRRKANNLASQKTYNDFDAFSTERGRVLRPMADDVENHSQKVLTKIAAAKSAEEAPIKIAMNASDKALAESTDTIPLGNFSDDLVRIVEEADKYGKDPIIANNQNIQDLRRLFNLTEDRNPRHGVRVADLPRIRDNISAIMKEGASGEAPAIKQFGDKLHRAGALDTVIEKLPKEAKEVSLKWKNVQIKYGDPWKKEYNSLNHAYERFNPKTGVLDVDGLTAHNTLINQKNRAVNNQVGSLVDNNIISVDDISKVYRNDAAAIALEKSKFNATSGAGNAENVKNFISGPNNPHQLIDKVASEVERAPRGEVPHTGDVMQYDPVEVVPDIKFFAKRLRETQRSLNSSLGNKGREAAKNIETEGNRLGSLFSGRGSVGTNRGKMEKINTIQESRYVQQSPGTAMAADPYSEVGLTKELDLAKLLRTTGMLGIQPVRELGEDFIGSTFTNDGTGGKGPVSLLSRLFKLSATKGPNG